MYSLLLEFIILYNIDSVTNLRMYTFFTKSSTFGIDGHQKVLIALEKVRILRLIIVALTGRQLRRSM